MLYGMEASKKLVFLQLVKLVVIVFSWTVQGSTEPVPSFLLYSPTVAPPFRSAALPPTTEEPVWSLPLNSLMMSPPYNTASPPVTVPPYLPPSTSEIPVAHSSRYIPQYAPAIHPSIPGALPPTVHQRSSPNHEPPVPEPITPVASPQKGVGQIPAAVHPVRPRITPSISPVQGAPPTSGFPETSPLMSPVMPGQSPPTIPDPDVSPASTPPTSIEWKGNGMPVAAPPNEILEPIPPVNHSPTKGSFSAVPPSMHNATRHSINPPHPSISPPKSSSNIGYHSPASSPSPSLHKDHHPRNKVTSPPLASNLVSPPPKQQDQVIPPAIPLTGRERRYAPPLFPPYVSPQSRSRHHAPPPLNPDSSVSRSHVSFPPLVSHTSPAPSPAPNFVSGSTTTFFDPHPPELSPSVSSSKSSNMPPPPPIRALPPPPPNEDCSGTICTEPLTITPPGSPCACVWPMQVGLRLGVDLYTFFPLVSELAAQVAAGVFMKQSQVRIMGANADSQQPDKTIVLIDLVPLGERFDNTTAFLTFQRFWSKKVEIKESYFGDYEVLYVRYQGLPPSPPMAPSSIGIIDNGPYTGNDNNVRTIKPLGVDVGKKRHKSGLSGSIIAIIVLSAFVVVVLCSAAAWVLLLNHRGRAAQQAPTPKASLPSFAKPSGTTGSVIGSVPSSASLSIGSSIGPYMGSAKTYSLTDIERATNNFDDSRILGEGGFGLVYSGVLDDGTKAAVKVLKRDDQQGGREFLAEVEMLSRLHHRNLVKLIGICTDERARCLVYELIPNGSVESHLHGVDKESAPLDWIARLKIALGAARGLAYLHEDSSPRVIHRDFKSSNILLEHDFTPKVSDFGLARTALDEESRHISTRVMGTFGYVAPEYAMTGQLLVKSDVYSYGVVLLELLTGRKPVDMSQPPGQESLVAWACPLLARKEGLEIMIDSSLGSDVPFDSVAKVAAIASMCVQAEVSHRPFMGEVVQALKLVCNECDEAKEIGSRTSSQDNLSIDLDARVSTGSGQLPDPLQRYQYSAPSYVDTERGLSVSELFSTSVRAGKPASGSFRMQSSSGPLRPGIGWQFWQRMRKLSGGSVSEHGNMFRLRPGSY